MDRVYEQYFTLRLGELGWRQLPAVASTGEAEQAYPGDLESAAYLDGQAHALVIDAVSRGSEGIKLRDDGALLLYSMAFELAARPVVFRESLSAIESRDLPELGDALTHDIGLVLRRAAEAEPSDEGISAHLLVDTLSASWSDLALASWRVWARSSG